MTQKYLRQLSDNLVQASEEMDVWVDPPNWQPLIDAATHDIQPSPGGGEKAVISEVDANGYLAWLWKIEGGPLAWVAVDAVGKDAQKLIQSKARRRPHTCRLKSDIDAAQLMIDDVGTPANLKTDITTDQTAMQAGYDSHEANYEFLWVDGTNP